MRKMSVKEALALVLTDMRAMSAEELRSELAKFAVPTPVSEMTDNFEYQVGQEQQSSEIEYIAACDLAKAIHAKHYRDDSPQWQVLPDIRGVISQIDNMTAGMVRRATPPAPANAIAIVQATLEAAAVITGVEIDLSKGEKHEHPDINTEDEYLCQVRGIWHFGGFSRQWYGLNFEGYKYNPGAGLQYDTPGWNSSQWERVIKVDIRAFDSKTTIDTTRNKCGS